MTKIICSYGIVCCALASFRNSGPKASCATAHLLGMSGGSGLETEPVKHAAQRLAPTSRMGWRIPAPAYLHDWPLRIVGTLTAPTSVALMCRMEEAVHSIKSGHRQSLLSCAGPTGHEWLGARWERFGFAPPQNPVTGPSFATLLPSRQHLVVCRESQVFPPIR